jgi:hypothetical protein
MEYEAALLTRSKFVGRDNVKTTNVVKVLVTLVKMTLTGSGDDDFICTETSYIISRFFRVHSTEEHSPMCHFCYDPWFAELRLSENDFLKGGVIQEEVRIDVYLENNACERCLVVVPGS